MKIIAWIEDFCKGKHVCRSAMIVSGLNYIDETVKSHYYVKNKKNGKAQ